VQSKFIAIQAYKLKEVDIMANEATQIQDKLSRKASEYGDTINDKLKSAGVDTDKISYVAREQISDLQRLIGDELRQKPFRTIGIAAVIGLVAGLLSSR